MLLFTQLFFMFSQQSVVVVVEVGLNVFCLFEQEPENLTCGDFHSCPSISREELARPIPQALALDRQKTLSSKYNDDISCYSNNNSSLYYLFYS
jgi:hypothetical protein